MEYIVEIEQGKLQGDKGTDFDGNTFLKFLGIPYAKPPIGDLRFKVAQPPEPWTGIRDATKNGDPCIQKDIRNVAADVFVGSEDCLHLNVFTKELPSSNGTLRPVIVYIHGGAFTIASNDITSLGPDYLITEDIVLVCINYRLGLLGFLAAEDPSLDIPGNNGLKDQTEALRWVQKNISKFGGDPKNVTIMGCSAGAASVHFHVLSPLSKGLFHKAIHQSGCALNPWAWGSKGNATNVAEVLGHKVSSEKEAVQVLRKTSAQELYVAQLTFYDTLTASAKRQFCPVIEKESETAFLSKEPVELLRSGEYNHVPMIFGHTDREGMLIDFPLLILSKKIDDAIPRQMNVPPNTKEHDEIIEQFRNVYNGPDENDNNYKLFSDSLFVAQIADSIRMHSKTGKSSLYQYIFTLDTEAGLLKTMMKLHHVKGVCHGDDIVYLFKNGMVPEPLGIKPGTLPEKGMRRYVKLLTNFAKTGNPTPPNNELNVTWPPVTSSVNIDYLDIGEELVVRSNPDQDRVVLWKKLSEKHPMRFSV